jgi:hypothetical protein
MKMFQFHEFSELCSTLYFSGLQDFGFSDLRYPGVHDAVTPNLLSFQFLNSENSISLLSGPTTQLSSLKSATILPSSEILGLRDFWFRGFGPRGFQTCFPFQPPTSEILIYFTLRAHTTQLSPTTMVARGTFRRVHVAFNDVIGSHHSRFSSRPTSTWYTSMCPRPFQVKSNSQIFLRSTT